MRRVMAQVDRVAPSESRVCILGETGTGKELVARAVHERSPRRDRPFVTVNCAAVPSELIESELFGHEKGAFTGAAARHLGKFEQAHGGTLFLDEIGDMPAAMQAKLLRLLQEGELERDRRRAADRRQHPRDRRHASRSRVAGQEGRVPRGSLSPDLRVSDRDAAAARAARRHSAAGRALRARWSPSRTAGSRAASRPTALERARALSLARQRPRAAQRRRARCCC